MNPKKRFWQRPWQIEASAGLLLTALALTLMASNVVLLLQNRELKTLLQIRSEPTYLSPGRSVPRLRGLDLQGNYLSFDLGARPSKTVLLVFQPDCNWCRKNMANWSALLDEADDDQFRFLAVSTKPNGVNEYIQRYPRLAELPLIAEPELNDQLEYRLFDTPQTIVIDGQGVVEKIWLGALAGNILQQAVDYFGITLPGIDSS